MLPPDLPSVSLMVVRPDPGQATAFQRVCRVRPPCEAATQIIGARAGLQGESLCVAALHDEGGARWANPLGNTTQCACSAAPLPRSRPGGVAGHSVAGYGPKGAEGVLVGRDPRAKSARGMSARRLWRVAPREGAVATRVFAAGTRGTPSPEPIEARLSDARSCR